MKKLMIAAAVVCAAVVSQAATVSWGVKSTMTPDSTGAFTSTSVGGDATMSVFLVDPTTYASLTFDKAFYDTYSKATADYTGATSMGNKTLKTGDTYGVGDHVYAAILLTYNDGKDTWFIANKADAVIAEFDSKAVDATISGLNTKLGGESGGIWQGGAITGWTKVESVPEPTSGLLLLLGVAGLALKRRRA